MASMYSMNEGVKFHPKLHVSDIKLLEKCCARNSLDGVFHLSGLGQWNNFYDIILV